MKSKIKKIISIFILSSSFMIHFLPNISYASEINLDDFENEYSMRLMLMSNFLSSQHYSKGITNNKK